MRDAQERSDADIPRLVGKEQAPTQFAVATTYLAFPKIRPGPIMFGS
jgi:hypothetical protein